MPDDKNLEMRIAAIEDKLSRLAMGHEEMSAHHRASVTGGVSPALSPQVCTTCYTCVISIPVSVPVHTRPVGVIAEQASKQGGGGTDFEKLGR